MYGRRRKAEDYIALTEPTSHPQARVSAKQPVKQKLSETKYPDKKDDAIHTTVHINLIKKTIAGDEAWSNELKQLPPLPPSCTSFPELKNGNNLFAKILSDNELKKEDKSRHLFRLIQHCGYAPFVSKLLTENLTRETLALDNSIIMKAYDRYSKQSKFLTEHEENIWIAILKKDPNNKLIIGQEIFRILLATRNSAKIPAFVETWLSKMRFDLDVFGVLLITEQEITNANKSKKFNQPIQKQIKELVQLHLVRVTIDPPKELKGIKPDKGTDKNNRNFLESSSSFFSSSNTDYAALYELAFKENGNAVEARDALCTQRQEVRKKMGL